MAIPCLMQTVQALIRLFCGTDLGLLCLPKTPL